MALRPASFPVNRDCDIGGAFWYAEGVEAPELRLRGILRRDMNRERRGVVLRR